MEPLTKEQLRARQARLAELAEAMGLSVDGDDVIAPLPEPITVDASAIDHDRLATGLMYLAYKKGLEQGRREVGARLHALIQDASDLRDVMPQEGA